jgi:hypothetical protein
MTQPNEMPVSDLDGAFKEAFHEYLEPFFAFCLEEVHADIDWKRGFEFLDKELQKIMPDSQTGPRSVDLLVRVWRRNGEEQEIYIHIEIQAQPVAGFPRRVFEYHYRISDRYRRPVANFVVLADDNPNWKPDRLTYNLWGCSVDFSYPIIKLSEFAKDLPRLEQSNNPFAVIILAHLKAMQTADDPESRRIGKIGLIKSLYSRWARDDVRKLVRLIDWLVKLPKELELKVRDEIYTFEQEKQMPHLTSFEIFAMEEGEAKGEVRGLQEGIAVVLKLKFGEAGIRLMDEIRQINDPVLLRRILDSIEPASDIGDVRRTWTESPQ